MQVSYQRRKKGMKSGINNILSVHSYSWFWWFMLGIVSTHMLLHLRPFFFPSAHTIVNFSIYSSRTWLSSWSACLSCSDCASFSYQFSLGNCWTPQVSCFYSTTVTNNMARLVDGKHLSTSSTLEREGFNNLCFWICACRAKQSELEAYTNTYVTILR
jgi:hypothetical protein